MGQRVTLAACALGAALVGALALGSCSPFGGGAYECSTDNECSGGGTCAMGYCAFADNDCASMLRYGELSGPNSGKCVGGGGSDSGVQDMTDAPPVNEDGMSCYGTGIVRACFTAPPTGTVNLTNTINTTNGSECDPNIATWCVVAGSMINVSSTVTATGTRALVLVSTGTISVQGALDVASHRVAASVGAGGNPASCPLGTLGTNTSGGAGGSFGGTGGGGAGTGGGTGGVPGGATPTPVTLRGGCAGQIGASTGGGDPGNGGGAVYLIAVTSISVIGSINASGSGGTNADAASSSGGGGGGAGGFIGLESPSVTVSGQVFANGGGGGEASGTASTGIAGGDSPSATNVGPGGAGGSDYATNGGNGSLGATLVGSPGDAACTGACTVPNSGGGGGGGAGIIRVIPAQSTGGTLSPPAT